MLIPEILSLDNRIIAQSDRVLTITGMDWSDYEQFDSKEYPGYRVSYCNGEIIVVSPSLNHEIIAEVINRLIIAYCEKFNILDFPFRQTRLQKAGKVAKEPDVAYSFQVRKSIPDLVVEVIFTSGNVNDLKSAYEIIGIRELWIWQNERITFYSLIDDRYTQINYSQNLPNIKSPSLSQFVNRGIKESPSVIKQDFLKLFGS